MRARLACLVVVAFVAAVLLLADLEPPDYESCELGPGWQEKCKERDR